MKNIIFFGFLWCGIFTNLIAADSTSIEKEEVYNVVGRAFTNQQLVLINKSGKKHRLFISSFVVARESSILFDKLANENEPGENCLTIENIQDELLPSYIAIIYWMHHYDRPNKFFKSGGTPLKKEMIKNIDQLSTMKIADDLGCSDVIYEPLAEHILKKLSNEDKFRLSAACCFFYYFLTR